MNITTNPAFEPIQSGDINLVEGVDQILKELGYKDPFNWKSHPEVAQAAQFRPRGQVFLINRYWRWALGRVKQDTSRERFSLNDQIDPDREYLKLFRELIAPSIVLYVA